MWVGKERKDENNNFNFNFFIFGNHANTQFLIVKILHSLAKERKTKNSFFFVKSVFVSKVRVVVSRLLMFKTKSELLFIPFNICFLYIHFFECSLIKI